jgi:hypothetical protein
MEFKTITGGIRQVEERYKEARAKTTSILRKNSGKKNPGLATRRLSGESRIYRNAPDD